MAQEKEVFYHEALVVLSGMGIKSNNKVMMPNGVAITAQEYLKEKLRYGENMPSSTDKLIPDYWIISGQVFKNKERFVKQQMEFNPGDIRENWESSFDHFAIPVYRNPIFVSEYENGVKTSFVRKNKVLQERCDRYEKALTNIKLRTERDELETYYVERNHDIRKDAIDALAAIGGDDE